MQPFQGWKRLRCVTQGSRSSPDGSDRQPWAEGWNPVGIRRVGCDQVELRLRCSWLGNDYDDFAIYTSQFFCSIRNLARVWAAKDINDSLFDAANCHVVGNLSNGIVF